MFIGVDGCKAGWFIVAIEGDGRWKIDIVPDIRTLWDNYQNASLILIDIPIGLREKGSQERLCDLDARKVLGPPRASSVFPAPCRPAVYAASYIEASRINEQMTGRRLSKQTWAIAPKIREVDEFLSQHHERKNHIREIHPEICFWALAGGRPMKHAKRTVQGFEERRNVLKHVLPQTDDIIVDALYHRKDKDVANDDILDGLVGAATAVFGKDRLATLPEKPELDSENFYCSCR